MTDHDVTILLVSLAPTISLFKPLRMHVRDKYFAQSTATSLE
jgi:hypothetical protein